ncbi:nucleotidyltransferase family protein [Pseudoxanthomonas dokdonensis]|uniref:MobA-like NTP transferase domain-containing protein n=1 Tax=Pseudoxanthomonas dokdonensis TaxID=344882 RepID=A0A0R0CNV2_9GAMM|nr:nucleotidyltransferase family protein [Pseudoxanthomonas dokdonensis]KRG71567.1 hypothetical protein ABB29_02015 [Pseudoxanthomonas dokdonensis]
MSRHRAVLLAAGGSRRLGRPKQLLLRDGEPLVRRVARLALATDADEVLVICGAFEADIRAALQGLPLHCLSHPDWQHGLGSSVRRAATQLQQYDGPVLMLTTDQPALTVSHLQALLQMAAASESGCAATAHTDGQARRAGIPAVVPAMLLRQAGLRADKGLRHQLNALPADRVGWLDAPELWRDLDTPQAMAEAIALGLLDPQ